MGYIYDVLICILDGVDVEIRFFCGLGIDFYFYVVSIFDVKVMVDVDVIFFNGFYFEVCFYELLYDEFVDKLWLMVSVFLSDLCLDWFEDGVSEFDFEVLFDFYIWNYFLGWVKCVEEFIEEVVKFDFENVEMYCKNGKLYVVEIKVMYESVVEKFLLIFKEC